MTEKKIKGETSHSMSVEKFDLPLLSSGYSLKCLVILHIPTQNIQLPKIWFGSFSKFYDLNQ